MSTAVVAIIAAAIGASGAVTAQITTAIATAKRERSRLEWEKERQDREWKIHEEERWLAEKQQLYATFGASVNEFLSYINARVYKTGHDIIPLPEQPDFEELNRIRSNIDLMAPEEVSRLAGQCAISLMAAVYKLNANEVPSDEIKDHAVKAISPWWDVYYAMRRDLHGERKRFKLPDSKTTEVEPDIPPAHTTRRWRREAKREARKQNV